LARKPRFFDGWPLATYFDQLGEVVDAVRDRIDVIMDGGVQRGAHVLKGPRP
jgi:isopentenyl diphosphate isomerase/L-lactate dehydrogenase-like FMN-dependent dehydrogenase